MHFLELLASEDERAVFLKRAETLTELAVAQTRGFLKSESANAQIDYLASLGGLYQLQARLKWLRAARKQLGLT